MAEKREIGRILRELWKDFHAIEADTSLSPEEKREKKAEIDQKIDYYRSLEKEEKPVPQDRRSPVLDSPDVSLGDDSPPPPDDNSGNDSSSSGWGDVLKEILYSHVKSKYKIDLNKWETAKKAVSKPIPNAAQIEGGSAAATEGEAVAGAEAGGAAVGAGAAAGPIGLAVMKLAETLNNMKEAPGKLAKGFGDMVTAETPSESIKGAGAAIKAFDFGQGSPAKPIGDFVEAIGNGVAQLEKWSNALNDTNMALAKFSGSMAQVQAESQVRKIVLDQERGDRRAQAARELSEARDRRERAWATISDKFHNKVGAPVMAWIENKLGGALEKIGDALEKLFPEEPRISGESSFGEWVERMTDTDFAAEYGVPPVLMDRNSVRDLLNKMEK